jgi:iron complex outermembrane receptor protein
LSILALGVNSAVATPQPPVAADGHEIPLIAQASPSSEGNPGPAAPAEPGLPGPNQTSPGAPVPDAAGPQPLADKPAPGQPLEQIEETGVKSDADQRRESTAAKIVIGREEIERFGDSTLDEVLKRLPGISIVGRARRGGSIVMRGLGHGYTQILINGERIPPGFSIDQLVPDQVERIEIYRAPTAETGARAIAGTINIVLREALRTHVNEVRLQLGEELERGQSNVSWVRNDLMGEHGTYNVTLSVAQTNFLTDTQTRNVFTNATTGATELDQDINTEEVDRRDNVHFTSRFQWQLGGGEQLVLQPFFTLSKTQTQIDGTLYQPVGLSAEPYATSLQTGDAHSVLGRVQAQWVKPLWADTKLEVHAYVGGFQSFSDALLEEYASSGARALTQTTETDISDRSWQVTAKVTSKLSPTQTAVGGAEVEDLHRDEAAATTQNGVPLLAAFGSDVEASVLRTAAYIQDDWSPAVHWAANAGLRWEGITTTSENNLANVTNESVVLTPLAHAVWRFDEPDRDQLRISLTRSYRAPSLQQLIALPSVTTLYPVTESNVASAPDKVGNPTLKPELATGLDIALEHYDFHNGVMSVSFFDRSIHDLIRNVTTLEDVVYSKFPRWVSAPVNFGDATTQGIEADAKFRLDDMFANLPPVTLNANISFYRSHVEDVIGPYNRLDQQPGVLANLGGDYKFPSGRLQIGGNVSWTPPFTVQSTNTQSTSYAVRRQIDVYTLWVIDPDTKLRFSATNLSPLEYLTDATTIQGNQVQNVITSGRTTTLFAVRIERRL